MKKKKIELTPDEEFCSQFSDFIEGRKKTLNQHKEFSKIDTDTERILRPYIEDTEKIINMTCDKYLAHREEERKQENIRKAEVRKERPALEANAKLIYEKFDMWFSKYENDSEVLSMELATGHYFYEPWYWGEIAPGSEKEFYVHMFNQTDWWCQNYVPVFEVCRQQIRNKLKNKS